MDEELNDFEKSKAQCRREYKDAKLRDLVRTMASYAKTKEDLEKSLAGCNAYYDVLRYELIPERMELDGIDKITYDEIGRVSLTADVFVSLKAGDENKAGLFSWLKKHKLADLIRPTINSSTLKAFIKERMKAGKPIPSEHLNVTPVTRASITKA